MERYDVMEYLTELSNLIMSNVQYVLLGMTVMILLALIIFISINIKLARMNKKYNTMMKGMDEVNVEQLLLNHIAQVKENVIKVDELSKEYQRMKEDSKKHVQKVGVVRFNAFEDMGSDLSFAIALLDYQNDGTVISSIYSRSESRMYAKPILAGQSSYLLTDEEKQAINQAIARK